MPWAQTLSVPDQETIALLRRYTDPGRYDWRAAGRLCDAIVPPGARIATTSAGIIPYLCDRPCLDLHGLTDPAIAHSPVDPLARGRMGHEHWLKEYGAIRARGVDVVVEWADPNLYPRAVATAPQDGHELVSARMPDGRFIDFTVLNPALLPAMRSDPRLVLFDRSQVADRADLRVLRARFAAATVVDTLDWAVDASETAHGFEEHEPPDAPYEASSKTTGAGSTGGRSGRSSTSPPRATSSWSAATTTPAPPAIPSRSTGTPYRNPSSPPAAPTNGGARPGCGSPRSSWSTEPIPSASRASRNPNATPNGTICGFCRGHSRSGSGTGLVPHGSTSARRSATHTVAPRS